MHIHSKWKKTNALLKDSSLAQAVPTTRPFHRSQLDSLLHQHRLVYVKPDMGTYGLGVIRVELLPEQEKARYRCRWGTLSTTFQTFDELYAFLLRRIKKRRYLIQKGVELLRYKKRRFDLRVMVQRGAGRKWIVSGIIGRLGHPRKIVTNYHSGGTPTDADKLLTPHMNSSEREQFLESLRKLGLHAARQLGRVYPGVCEVGVDVAVDEAKRPWILEVNTLPDPYIFRHCRDKSVFPRVYRLHRMNRRGGSSRCLQTRKKALPCRRGRANRAKA